MSYEPPNTHLSCGFGSLPDAEVAYDPGDEETQGQVPVQRTQLVDAGGDPEHSSPALRRERTDVSASNGHVQGDACGGEDENSLPELHDRRGGVRVGCVVD